MTQIENNVSPGLWALAWRRLRSDHAAMVAMVIVALFLLMLVLSKAGLVAADWSDEVGVSYAPPSFVGAASDASNTENAVEAPPPENPRDPLADVIRQLRAETSGQQSGTIDYYGIKDPLQNEMDEIHHELAKNGKKVTQVRKSTLPFGADKWGHDIIKKTIKGAETSITVGLVAAFLATFLGTIFGAVSGYYGKWVDDFFNWFYSVFTSIPYLLLILAVAAVLQQKGVLTIILILGLTGWTGTYRLIRAEYLKHKSRE
jgi:peptide/nickel transport system permease protein